MLQRLLGCCSLGSNYIITFAVVVALILTTKIVSIGTLVGCVLLPALVHYTGDPVIFKSLLIISAFIIIKHRSNIVRLIKGQENKLKASVGVIGAGAWGTTIANILADNGHDVHLLLLIERRDEISNQRHHRLPDVKLNSRIQPTTDLSKCYDHEFVVLGLSSQQLIMMKDELQWDKMKTIVTLAKGIVEPEIFISDWISKFYMGNIVVLSGPNLALEIAQKKPAATVVACKRMM